MSFSPQCVCRAEEPGWGGKEKELPLLLFRWAPGSVLVDAEDADAVELRQLGDQDAHQGDGVDDKVYPVVLGVKAG